MYYHIPVCVDCSGFLVALSDCQIFSLLQTLHFKCPFHSVYFYNYISVDGLFVTLFYYIF